MNSGLQPPRARADQPMAHNMTLLSHNELQGFGGMGEGIAIQIADDGRRILWLAHESAPKNFTGVDVTDPRKPRVIVQTELPHMKVRSNSLDVVGNIMVVANQVKDLGAKPAGINIYDISKPESPRLISHFDCSGPYSRGVHAVWFVDGKTVHMASGAPDFQPRDPRDDQIYRIVDISDPTRPRETGRWWYPGTREGDAAPPPKRLPPQFDTGFRAHNTNVFPQRPDRAYVGYIDGGAIVLDIADPAHIKMVSHWNHSPPFNGFTHTVLPLFERKLWIVSDECVQDDGADWPKLVWVVDSRSDENPLPISTFPAPPHATFAKRGGRFGAHNLHENLPLPCSFQSETLFIGT
ncbi:MAG: LVIVD repeat-containing protein, partial [Hylemonella sp.]